MSDSPATPSSFVSVCRFTEKAEVALNDTDAVAVSDLCRRAVPPRCTSGSPTPKASSGRRSASGYVRAMTPDEQRAFVGQHHHTVLVTRRADERLQTSPIACGVDGDGRVVISVTADRAKTKNLRRDPRATLCVLSDGFFGEWVQIDGRAEVVDLPDAMDGLINLYRSVQGEHPDWDDFRAAMERDRRCLLRITIDG